MTLEIWLCLWGLGAAVFVTWWAILTAADDPNDTGFPDV